MSIISWLHGKTGENVVRGKPKDVEFVLVAIDAEVGSELACILSSKNTRKNHVFLPIDRMGTF